MWVGCVVKQMEEVGTRGGGALAFDERGMKAKCGGDEYIGDAHKFE